MQVKQSCAQSINLVPSCSRSSIDCFSLPKVERLFTSDQSATTQGRSSITSRAMVLASVMTRRTLLNTCLRSSMRDPVVLEEIGMKLGSRARTRKTSRRSSQAFMRNGETSQRMVTTMKRPTASLLCLSLPSLRLSARECFSNTGGYLLTSGQSGCLASCLVYSLGSPSFSPTRPCKVCRT
jgi:hypothetical protein